MRTFYKAAIFMPGATIGTQLPRSRQVIATIREQSGRPVPRLLPALSVLLLLMAGAAAGENGGDDAGKQAELDRLCEAARDEKLAPIREDIYAECLEGRRGDEAYCRRYADSYDGERAGGAPRFYELPECEEAFEFRRRKRR